MSVISHVIRHVMGVGGRGGAACRSPDIRGNDKDTKYGHTQPLGVLSYQIRTAPN